MLRFLSTVLAVVAGLFIFVFLFAIILGGALAGSSRAKPLPGKIVLELDARQSIADAPNGMPADLGGPALTVVGLVEALEQAKSDSSVKGLFLRASSSLGVDPGQAEEIRDAIADFKASGKYVVSHVQDLTDPGLGGYFLASVADEVWMQPSGLIFSQGIGISSPYFKGTLDKLDASAEVLHYHEYKTAMHPFIHDAPTEAETEENLRMITSIFESFTGSIAESRKISREEFEALLDGGPYTAQEAVSAGWVDEIGFDVDAEDAAAQRAGEGADTVDIADYGRRKGTPYKDGAVIALIEGDGEIVEGEAEPSFFGATNQIASDTTSQAILDAVEDEDVKAIVFRVNSPGGSATASDQIWNAVARARAEHKPVVIDMSGVAASGGYWISMGADWIVAEPSTLTGSIGVVGAKFVLRGVYDKLGISVSEMSVGGPASFMFSDQRPFTPEEWLALHKIFDVIYGTFVSKVAEGRKLQTAKVEEIAKGRVWTGSDAKARGLVDELGGLKTAIAAAKRLASIDKDAPIELRRFPGEKSFVQQLFEAFGASAEVARSLSVFAAVMRLAPTAEIMDAAREHEASSRDPVRARAQLMHLH